MFRLRSIIMFEIVFDSKLSFEARDYKSVNRLLLYKFFMSSFLITFRF